MFKHTKKYIFKGACVTDIFQKHYESIKVTIDGESENYILNVNEMEYIRHLEGLNLLIPPEIHFDQFYADSYEKDIPDENFPDYFHVIPGKKYKMEIVQFFVPCSGDVSLLNNCPDSLFYMNCGGNFEIQNNSLLVEFINFSNNAEKLKLNYHKEINGIINNYHVLRNDIEIYNKSLKAQILAKLNQRRQKLLSKSNLLSSLGVPLKNKNNLPLTYSVPKLKFKEKIVIKPFVSEKGLKPEPTLDNDNYRILLKHINDVGKNFERMPKVYSNKNEEDLRDHILMNLDPLFEFGCVSGETFNKTGRTDIQFRYDSSVIFIAECKFWRGEKNYLSTIDQLLNYLTWRDTKVSIIVFVREKDITAIIEKVKKETCNHSNYLSYVNSSDENWFNYRFHLNGDSNREVKLAVQIFHLPKDNKIKNEQI